jgi:predicted DNA-binding transcriptional regulator AlpA
VTDEHHSVELAALLPSIDAIDELPVRTLPAVIAELIALQARAVSRLREHDASPKPVASPDRLLDVRQAAARLGMSPDWLYRHKRELPFARRIGRRAVRFSEAGLERWERQRR